MNKQEPNEFESVINRDPEINASFSAFMEKNGEPPSELGDMAELNYPATYFIFLAGWLASRAKADLLPEQGPVAQWHSDADLRRMWRAAGGNFHGPHIETGTMPESALFPFLRNLLDARPPQPGPGEGWKLVPVEPTPEMMRAGETQASIRPFRSDIPGACWAAMLAAAPALSL